MRNVIVSIHLYNRVNPHNKKAIGWLCQLVTNKTKINKIKKSNDTK